MSAALREEICRVGASLYARGYVHASAGNISVRLADGGFLITPTDACLGTLDPARLAQVDAHGVQTHGERASKTLALHKRIYAADPDAGCVIHTHSMHLVALTLAGVWSADELRFAFSCGPKSRKAANLAANPRLVVGSEDTVECLSLEGRAHAVDGDRRDQWIDRYLDKYGPLAPELSAEFLRQNIVFEVVPERAFAVIEREDEFATRATRWRFPASD